MIPQLLLGLAVAWSAYSAIALATNVRRARAMDVPLIVVPISPMNILWIVIEPLVFRILDSLPFTLGSFSRYARRGWHFHDKAASHVELGDAWALVTPREIFLHICDPEAINDIFARRQDFVRPVQLYKMLDVFGSNVSTVGWTEWQRQRKVVAAPFNENTNKLVWSESLNQARDMIQAWTGCGQSGTVGVARDTRTLSLDVLAATGFHKSYKFRASTEPGSDEARNYRESLAITLDNALFMMLVPPKLLTMPFIPKTWARIGQATNDFRQYMMDMFNEERRLLDAGKPGTGNLMSSLVRVSEDEQKKKVKDNTDRPRGLTISEILGNIFVINFAGHDTTANTLAYSMLLLAAYPEVQDWVGEELQELLQNSNSETWSYEQLFPRLKRCQAVLLETIRLFPPIMALPKYTNQHSQILKVGNKTISIDLDTMVVPSLLAMHTHPKYWKQDPLVWRPSRWISSSSSPSSSNGSNCTISARLECEELFVPTKGSYFPWSDGPQNCPGKKFAQVEFVAVIACLLQAHRVQLHRAEGGDLESARKWILAVCEDSEHGLLLRMRNADSVRLIWKRL
ncbi:MAG: hypothetical protein M1830_002146 [Pleopsidium flavum]|nr:MAG: hypothetical protein M1830_002146 [Pleopsidium flavum]